MRFVLLFCQFGFFLIETLNILKYFRMDIDCSARKKAKDYFNVHDPDFYEIECKKVVLCLKAIIN